MFTWYVLAGAIFVAVFFGVSGMALQYFVEGILTDNSFEPKERKLLAIIFFIISVGTATLVSVFATTSLFCADYLFNFLTKAL